MNRDTLLSRRCSLPQTYAILGKVYAQLPMSQFRKRLSMRSSSQRQLYGLPGTPGAPPALSSSPRDAASSVTKPKIDAITASFGGGLFMLEVSSPAVMVWRRARVCGAESVASCKWNFHSWGETFVRLFCRDGCVCAACLFMLVMTACSC